MTNYNEQYVNLYNQIQSGDIDTLEAMDTLRILRDQSRGAEPETSAACTMLLEDLTVGAASWGMINQ